jgi:predicted flap endonuclease-1-like 5' DNA nuclease
MLIDVNFILPADRAIDANNGVLLGDFNNWDQAKGIPLTKTAEGSFQATVPLAAGKHYEYRYLLDGHRWVNDEHAENPYHNNCTIYIAEPLPPPAPTAEISNLLIKPLISSKKDDLTKIEGIGKKIAELLIAENITSFETLSKCHVKTLRDILDAAGSRFKSYNPATWANQAKLAADGNWTALKNLQKELKIAAKSPK